MHMNPIALNGRSYRLPSRPVVVICADGCDPAYIEAGLSAGVLPRITKWRDGGFYTLADAVMPTFTNPNNMSLVTGAPPSVHGISGNFALDRETGAEIMMNDPAMLRSDTLLALMSQAGVAVAAITAKDKLRQMLGRLADHRYPLHLGHEIGKDEGVRPARNQQHQQNGTKYESLHGFILSFVCNSDSSGSFSKVLSIRSSQGRRPGTHCLNQGFFHSEAPAT